MLNGVRLDLPGDSGTYRFTDDLIVDENHITSFLYDGQGGQFTAIFENWLQQTGGQQGVDDSPMQSAFAGVGAGTRTFNIEAVVYEDSDDTFGNTVPSDSAVSKAQTFMHDLANARIDSTRTATFEWAEYSEDGKFGPLAVVPTERDIDTNRRESSSEAGVRLTLVEAANLSETVDSLGAPNAEMWLQPAGLSTPRIPLPMDTLGLGEQALRRFAAESGLVDTNGNDGGSNPTTLVTKLLPKRVALQGAFRGQEAESIATTLRDEILANDGVDRVEVVSPNLPDNPLTGTFALGDESSILPVDPRASGIYGFDLDLREV
ncbi:hypothetical protein [Halosimplex halophilum]|uniref:hypothetical protein n=1 Tax=Halosimplex halophilum TaxID=2559572 RepID=UPI00107F5F25|nr:hypothetical protein [Halosimplex halophilum]